MLQITLIPQQRLGNLDIGTFIFLTKKKQERKKTPDPAIAWFKPHTERARGSVAATGHPGTCKTRTAPTRIVSLSLRPLNSPREETCPHVFFPPASLFPCSHAGVPVAQTELRLPLAAQPGEPERSRPVPPAANPGQAVPCQS